MTWPAALEGMWGMASRRRGQPTVEDAGETRQTILRAAHRLFMEFGYRAVSTRQIAEACGLTQPALYHHFADKQDLYVAVLREELATLHSGLDRIARRGGGVGTRLRQVVRFLPATQQDMGQMFHDIDHELAPEARRTLEAAFFQGIVAPIAAIFEDGVRRGLLRDQHHGGVDAVTGAFLLLSMLRYASTPHGHAPLTVSTSRTVDLQARGPQQAGTIVRVLLYGLAQPGVSDDEGDGDGTSPVAP